MRRFLVIAIIFFTPGFVFGASLSYQKFTSYSKAIKYRDSVEELCISNDSGVEKCNFGIFPKLKVLSISFCHINQIPASVFNCITLNHLEFYGNDIENVSKEITRLKNLTELSFIEEGKIISLPENLLDLPVLKSLILTCKNLHKLPKPGTAGNSIEVLELNNCKKLNNKAVLDFLSGFTTLKQITLYDLNLRNFWLNPGKTIYLESINLGKNPRLNFDYVIQVLSSLPNLTSLDYSENKLTRLPTKLFQLKSLTKLYLANNKIRTIPDEICELQNLTELDLHHNNLNSIPEEIGQLSKLRFLGLSGNIKTVPVWIFNLKYLENLSLSYSKIRFIPKDITHLQNLKSINLYHNKLNNVPAEITQLKKLEWLNIAKNPMSRSTYQKIWYMFPKGVVNIGYWDYYMGSHWL